MRCGIGRLRVCMYQDTKSIVLNFQGLMYKRVPWKWIFYQISSIEEPSKWKLERLDQKVLWPFQETSPEQGLLGGFGWRSCYRTGKGKRLCDCYHGFNLCFDLKSSIFWQIRWFILVESSFLKIGCVNLCDKFPISTYKI